MDMDFWEEQCVGHAPPDIIRKQRKPDAALSVEEMVDVDAIRAMKANGTWLVPTMLAPAAALQQARADAAAAATSE